MIRIVVLYAFIMATLVGCITSASFTAAVIIGLMGYVIGRWRAVDSPARIEVIGRDVQAPVRVPRAIVRRVWWFL